MEFQSSNRARLPHYRNHSANSSTSGPLAAVSRPRSQLSRESTFDSNPAMEATTSFTSQFLRDALERERAARRTTLEHNDRAVQSSPIRAATAEPSRRRHRADSSEGFQPPPMGSKEASETISKLSNENFRLKYELYQRQEREAVLEDRLEKLETERDQIEKELRSKVAEKDAQIKEATAAINEAVAFIADLESQLAQHRSGGLPRASPVPSTPKISKGGPAQFEDDITTLARMPSFVSDMSANTENLRRVYLNNHGSVLNLNDPEPVEHRGRTPSLSILDEIYADVRPPVVDPPAQQPTPPVQESLGRTKEEKRQAIEKALADVPLSHRQGRLEKRDNLQPVMTSMPLGRDMMPPTPDTVSSSVLERGRGSKDTLLHQPSIPEAPEPIHGSLSNPSAAPSVTAFNDRKGYYDPIPRPRSASEATTTPRWDVSDTDSLESDVDIWLRERGRESPDMFSFPILVNPRLTNEHMYGIANATSSISRAAPPPPNRRSSLHAHTSIPVRPKTRGTPSVVRNELYPELSNDSATPPPIQLKRAHVETLQQPDDGGVSLRATSSTAGSSTAGFSTNTSQSQVGTAPSTPSTERPPTRGPPTPSSANTKKRWFNIGRVASLRKGNP